MALLGCGCCECCAEGTSTWNEPFDTTPTVGPVWDAVTNITGPSARSYPPAVSNRAAKKTSELTLNCDSESPMYLSYNGTPYGGLYGIHIQGYTDIIGWQLPVPASGGTATGIMSLRYENELIFKFGSQEYRSGAGHYWEKRLTRNSAGAMVPVMLLQMYGYEIRNGGTRRVQRTISSGYLSAATGSYLPYLICEYKYSVFGVVLDPRIKKCEKLVEVKWGMNGYFRSSDNPTGLQIPLALNEPAIEMAKVPGPGYEKFQCYVGTETRVRWDTSYSAAGKFTGNFNFGGGYVQWESISWRPSNS